jgi:2-methylisocitrate lyase-like PEP mutase family enzyme
MEMARIARSFDVPLLANMVEGGRTPLLSARQLEELSFRIAIYPVAGLLAAAAALQLVYRRLRETGVSVNAGPAVFPFAECNKLMGFEEIWEFERRHAEYPEGGVL